jgi:hypothetical protein
MGNRSTQRPVKTRQEEPILLDELLAIERAARVKEFIHRRSER